MASSLPPEILQAIFTNIREEEGGGCKAVVPFLTVCRSWHLSARSVIWNHIVLDQDTVKPFIATFPQDGPVEEILSLTLYLKEAKLPGLAWRFMDSQLRHIVQFVPRMTRMLSFSFHVCSSYYTFLRFNSPGDGSNTGKVWQDLRPLIQALPPSVIHLEIETNECNSQEGTKDHLQLCDEIRAIIPRLHNIRLSLTFVCDRVIRSPDTGAFVHAPNLKSLTISFCPRGGFARSIAPRRECPNVHGDPIRGPETPALSSVPRIVASLRDACIANCFPRAEKVEVDQLFVGKWDEMPSGPQTTNIPLQDSHAIDDLGERYFKNAVIARDCLNDQTWIIPIMRLFGHAQETFVFHRQFRRFVNKWPASMDIAEAIVWGISASGARLPFDMAGMDLRFATSKALDREGQRNLPRGLPTGINWEMNSDATGFLPQVMVEQGVDVAINRFSISQRIWSHWPPPSGSLDYDDA